ncbi:MAG: hydrogenase formation protein HypD [DPANN group archaeon]|nr:hydrogenase formation protein HypD [DPANN group archaeon]
MPVDENLKNLISEINKTAEDINRSIKIMEVCGTHTQTIAKYGIKSILPKNIELVSGPGCPVCVTPQKTIDSAVRLAIKGIPIATYGDMLKVPGTEMSLETAKENGANIFIVESTIDALKLKAQYPNLVFLAIGFETTTPMTAWAVKNGLDIICAHKTIPEAMNLIVSNKDNQIDGFLNPGHVSSIIGTKPYKNINASQVIAGFEPKDILKSLLMLLRQIKADKKDVENNYTTIVDDDGNNKARELTSSVFDQCDSNWRGIGTIKDSGLKLKKEYQTHDAIDKYKKLLKNIPEPKENTKCKCTNVIMGMIEPEQCPLFSKICTPDNPIGPCMVGSESGCKIAYKYRGEDYAK